jgi:tetratricopeptide (TPR) repeat protein
MPAMRVHTIIFTILATLPASPGLGQDATSQVADPKAVKADVPGPLATSEQRLDNLFLRLKKERSSDQARGIANEIRDVLTHSSSPTVDFLMESAARAMDQKRYGAALDFLDQVTLLAPDYVEGWNRRATLHYLLGNYPKAMSDSARVLALEPRHLGALAGMAGILQESGHERQALKAWENYLAYYPADREAQQQLIELMNKLAGQKT